mmetsp:Transcript_3822/g.5517  ORF Transcript_3822/g.5517 Transcript_3822/m.5517 type:complete len:162 (-) Transcript_3822:419-904(-)|eukprot:CAMPEP_0203686002 /NCGR_PEP_ID=MMETSP0090-20130426/48839_1 /ASSEMBLY_ACC=CAM_ASM_001088 /TAXON_ID=426623 /ORGANISM="Chaetoceros affinis, Strain CCMP159" /LENGTH=161 /DNA_ID=CAMNT_0050555217 /DNA_START=12 /DNA_END=497 /DNA_ORIENTATION=-
MPRLGESTVDAYPERNYKNALWLRTALAFFSLVLLHNIFTKDYRNEGIDVLRNSGLSQEEINAIIPQTLSERITEREEKKDEFEQMKDDIKVLQEEMSALKVSLGISGSSNIDNNNNTDSNKVQVGGQDGKEDAPQTKTKMETIAIPGEHPVENRLESASI